MEQTYGGRTYAEIRADWQRIHNSKLAEVRSALAVVRVRSHRAREKLEDLVGESHAGLNRVKPSRARHRILSASK